MKNQIISLGLVVGLLTLFSASSHAQSPVSGDETYEQSEQVTPEINAEDMSMSFLRRPKPKPQMMFRCCAKPATYGAMYCNTGPDKVFSWDRAISMCEDKYGKGNCVSGCRRVVF